MIKTYAISTNQEINEETFSKLLNIVQEPKKSKILRYRFKEDIIRSALGDYLLKYCLKTDFCVENYEINYNSFGKPFLKNNRDLFFNISHSGEWIVCSVATSKVGIDIEQVSPLKNMQELAKYFMTEKEKTNCFQQSPACTIDCFFTCWTQKEAFVKCVGRGLSLLEEFNPSLVNISSIPYNNEQYYFNSSTLNEKYKLSICCNEPLGIHNIIYKILL